MSIRRFAGIALSGLLALVFAACDADRLSKLKPGSSSGDEVRKLMGQPTLEWVDADGTRVWEYPRTPEGIVNYMLVIGPDNVLREVRQVLTEENFARVRPGMSSDEVRYMLGRPAHEVYFSLKQEKVWDWKTKVEPGMTWYFNVHFNNDGVVTRTSTSFVGQGGG
ncbi:outer membrane protein assembly factor BamE [Accumulibacter sp.]|uniref:outer membrane protein assembly factor BamE domain-containing protein n=1 Tax=Accumulibacter sp. TaxID=2053492 RepID=UPI001D89629D|nr:outer membrane protein assembly factor BamE [Accumulibacter sp.]MCB1933025.1 outer membrane protein assembly factor BamE [Accumulibacter sp.]MCP5227503.1 outer membrane protein assembly factor BamE [Accumulibacter sp.]